jgi:hypothetical protein
MLWRSLFHCQCQELQFSTAYIIVTIPNFKRDRIIDTTRNSSLSIEYLTERYAPDALHVIHDFYYPSSFSCT